MKVYKYEDLDGTHYITEQEILQIYMPYWTTKMQRAGKADMISEERCIEDFITVHWATPVQTLNEG